MPLFSGTESSGARPPLDSLYDRTSEGPSPEPKGRRRRCLLKDCDRWFRPCCPQARYCSATCQQEAEWWRRWRGSQQYRATARGKAHRREQSRRYRQRRRESSGVQEGTDPPERASAGAIAGNAKQTVAAALESKGSVAAAAETVVTSADVVAPAAAGREGQRPAEFYGGDEGRPCARPGCYCLFVPQRCAPGQRFGSVACRRALRRVLDRQERWWQRHRRRWRPQGEGPARPP